MPLIIGPNGGFCRWFTARSTTIKDVLSGGGGFSMPQVGASPSLRNIIGYFGQFV